MAAPAGPKVGVGEAPAATPGAELAQRLTAFTRELDYVYRTLRRYGVEATDAEDLAQEVFLVAWRRRADFDGTRPLRPWLAGIAFKVAHQHHRRRRPEFADVAVEDLVRVSAVELEPEAMDARALVLRVLANLPERHRTVLILHDIDGVSVDDIAALWVVPRFTLYTRLRRARVAFAREVAQLRARDPSAQRATAAALAPAQLLALERDVPPAPPGLRERVIERLRAEGTLGAGRDPAPSAPSPAAPLAARPWTVVVVVVSVGLGLAVATLTLVRPAATGASTATAPLPSAGLSARGSRAAGRGALPPPRILDARTGAVPLPERLGSGLTGFWRFDDAAGSRFAADSSPGGHHCELRDLDPGRAWVPGAAGGAVELAFQGWLECPQPALPARRSAAFTVAAWVKRAGNPHMHHVLAMRPMGSRRANYFFFGFDGDTLKVASSGWGGILDARFPPSAVGRWVHVAFSYGDDHTLRLYIGGAEVARRKVKKRAFAGVQGPLRIGAGLIGRERDRVGQHFEGAIDELMVYERALSDEEIRSLVSRGRGAETNPPVSKG